MNFLIVFVPNDLNCLAAIWGREGERERKGGREGGRERERERERKREFLYGRATRVYCSLLWL